MISIFHPSDFFFFFFLVRLFSIRSHQPNGLYNTGINIDVFIMNTKSAGQNSGCCAFINISSTGRAYSLYNVIISAYIDRFYYYLPRLYTITLTASLFSSAIINAVKYYTPLDCCCCGCHI